MSEPQSRSLKFLLAEVRRVSHGYADLRGLGAGRGTRNRARIAGLADRQDGGATQHQVFQVHDGHGRPPAIKRRVPGSSTERRASDSWRISRQRVYRDTVSPSHTDKKSQPDSLSSGRETI